MIDPTGKRCRCGRVGCWETEVGPAAPARMATPNRPYGTGPQVVRDPEERPAEIGQRRAGGDPRAEAAVAEVGRWLGTGAALNLFNPWVIVPGGSFARHADPLIPAARREPARTGMSDDVERCRFTASDLGSGVVVERAPVRPHQHLHPNVSGRRSHRGNPDGLLSPLVLTRPRPPRLPPT